MGRWKAGIAGLLGVTALVTGAWAWPREHAHASAAPRDAAAMRAAVGARVQLAQAMARAAATLPPPPPEWPVRWACVRIVGTDHVPVAGAVVTAGDGRPVTGREDDAPLVRVVADEEGRAALPVAAQYDAVVDARAPDGREGRDIGVTLGAHCAGAEPVEVLVREIATLRGLVVDERGAPVAHAELTLRPLAGEDDPHVGDALVGDPGEVDVGWQSVLACQGAECDALAFTADDGTFLLPLSEPGAYTVTAHAEGTTRGFAGPVQILDGGDAEARIVLRAGGAAVGTVVDDAGHPVAGAYVTVAHDDVQTELRSGADGTFRVDGLPRVAWTAAATVYDHVAAPPRPIALDAPATRLVVSRGARLVVHACLDGTPGAALGVSLDAAEPAHAWLTRDADGCGTATMGALVPGSYRLWLSAPDLVWGAGTVVVRGGETRVEVRADRSRAGHVRARYPRGVTGTPVGIGASSGSVSAFAYDGGGLLLVGDCAGLRITSDGYASGGQLPYHAEAIAGGSGDVELVLAPTRDGAADDDGSDYEESCWPPVELQWSGDRVTYGSDQVEPALLPGDRILSVDGHALSADHAGSGWQGRCGERVLLRVYRPATAATFTVRTTRSEYPEDD